MVLPNYTHTFLKMSTIIVSSRVSARGLINGTRFRVILVGTANKTILEFPSHLRNFFPEQAAAFDRYTKILGLLGQYYGERSY